MVVLRPEPTVVIDERSKDLLFKLIAHRGDYQDKFAFDDMLRMWFHNDVNHLAKFLEWLEHHGLQIRGKV